jgi:hypothetical protein
MFGIGKSQQKGGVKGKWRKGRRSGLPLLLARTATGCAEPRSNAATTVAPSPPPEPPRETHEVWGVHGGFLWESNVWDPWNSTNAYVVGKNLNALHANILDRGSSFSETFSIERKSSLKQCCWHFGSDMLLDTSHTCSLLSIVSSSPTWEHSHTHMRVFFFSNT